MDLPSLIFVTWSQMNLGLPNELQYLDSNSFRLEDAGEHLHGIDSHRVRWHFSCVFLGEEAVTNFLSVWPR